jgi:predicted molibdopterin-dependent oxidoreductase YjgC
METENTLFINGQELRFTPGETILEVAQRNGVYIPTLCYLKGASPTGACRVCLVEVKGARNLVASCAAPAGAGMEILTESPRVIRARRLNIELLLTSGQHNCLVREADLDEWTDFQLKTMEIEEHEDICPAYGECKLQDLAIQYRARTDRFPATQSDYPVENVNPFIVRDFSRCILCGRCVQACNEVQVNNAISHGYRGKQSKIVARGDLALRDADCVFCGECVQACPVGALVPKAEFGRKGPKPEAQKIRTTCSYCGVGCQIYLHVQDGRVVKATGVEDVGPNYGSLCVKGRFGNDFIHDENRLTKPLIREGTGYREAEWDEALNLVAEKLGKVKQEAGADAIQVLTSARITNEENYVAQKFTRAALGTNNVDHCARL